MSEPKQTTDARDGMGHSSKNGMENGAQNASGTRELPTPGDDVSEAAVLRCLRSLEHLPPVAVPPAFAARVARLAAAQPLRERSLWAGFGPRIALGSSFLLLAALFAVAAHAQPSFLNMRFDIELLLLVQLGALGLLMPHLGSDG